MPFRALKGEIMSIPIGTIPIGPVRNNGVKPEKNAQCVRYGSCLDFALEKKWHNFSCSACKFFATGAPHKPEPVKVYTRVPYYYIGGEE